MKWEKIFNAELMRTSFDLVSNEGVRFATVRVQFNRWIFTSKWLNAFSHTENAFIHTENCPPVPIYHQEGESEKGFYSNAETAKKAAYMHVLQQLAIEEASKLIYESITLNTPLTELGLTINVRKLKNS